MLEREHKFKLKMYLKYIFNSLILERDRMNLTPVEEPRQAGTVMILGEVASSGLARGRALLCDCGKQTVAPRRLIAETEIEAEVKRFDEAISAVEQKLRNIQSDVRQALGAAEAEIFEAQILLLRDEGLRRAVREICASQKINVEAALEHAIQRLADSFERLKDTYLRERAADLREIGNRLLDYLSRESAPGVPADLQGCVLIASELFSSAVAQLHGRGVRALITERGGLTAHSTILARALGIPMLIRVPQATKVISPGNVVIVDALAGRAFVNPPQNIIRAYDRLEADLKAHQSTLQEVIDLPCVTQDGVEAKLSANIGQTGDAVAAVRVKADGAGLYRTEFVFFAQDHFPSEAEQYRFYRATAEQLRPKGVVIRLLDIGSDKALPYYPLPAEVNPALGSRGVRLLLSHPEILRNQLRAILRLSSAHPVSLLLPMVRGLDELQAIKAMVKTLKSELAGEGQSFNPAMPLGVMIETPSAATLASALADEADFFSIGTNDLVQYLLAADRAGGGLDSDYEPLHPAVVRTLAALAITARSKRKPISLCGEIAGDPRYTALLLGLGFRSFSVTPGRLMDVKYAIRSIDLKRAEQLAVTALTLDSAPAIRALVQEDWRQRSPVSSPNLFGAAAVSTTPPDATHDEPSRTSGDISAIDLLAQQAPV